MRLHSMISIKCIKRFSARREGRTALGRFKQEIKSNKSISPRPCPRIHRHYSYSRTAPHIQHSMWALGIVGVASNFQITKPITPIRKRFSSRRARRRLVLFKQDGGAPGSREMHGWGSDRWRRGLCRSPSRRGKASTRGMFSRGLCARGFMR